MISTKNPQSKSVNQKRGPTTGNAGTPVKAEAFVQSKTQRTSYMGQLADMVTAAFGRRGEQMKPNKPAADDYRALGGISTVTRVKRGPTRGNK